MASSFMICNRFFSTSRLLNNVFNHVTVVGGGLMGSGIAQVTAQAGMDVTIVELNDEAAKKSDSSIQSSIARIAKKLFQNSTTEAEKYISETMGRLKISTNLLETVSKTDLVIEAIVENLSAKHQLFKSIDPIAPLSTIFASNTSSLSITEIASVTSRKNQFGGLHFFNPVPVMKLLEVIRTEETSDDTYQKMMSFGKAIGKVCISCKDTPGFVVNRLLVPYLAEAVRMLERKDSSAKDIDLAMKLGAGYPMGPLELLDYVGLDTTKFILDGWYQKHPDNPLFAPIALLNRLVSEGKLGKKTGEGFYSYKKSYLYFADASIHSPYFQPLPTVKKLQNSSASPEPKPLLPSKKKVESSGKSTGTRMTEPLIAKMEKQIRMQKLDKLKLVNQWKNTEDFLNQRDGFFAFKKIKTRRFVKNSKINSGMEVFS